MIIDTRTREQKAFDAWRNTFVKLLARSKHPEISERVVDYWRDTFSDPAIQEMAIQAFSNLLWDIDRKIQKDVQSELRIIQTMITKSLPAFDPTKMKVEQILSELILEDNVEAIDLTDEEIDELGGPEDNSPLV